MKNRFNVSLIQIGIMLVILLMFFYHQFSGKSISATDIVQWESMSRETSLFSNDGTPVLWAIRCLEECQLIRLILFASSNYLGVLLNYFFLILSIRWVIFSYDAHDILYVTNFFSKWLD
ncbi:MAG: hypothetical protein IPJ13_23875 [Saprospiraceae bacterium]|nr:hypothetical protein [Saprospiraceae bacterium]